MAERLEIIRVMALQTWNYMRHGKKLEIMGGMITNLKL